MVKRVLTCDPMLSSLQIAVVGATGLVGQEFLRLFVERGWDPTQVHWLASERSVGKNLTVGETTVPIEALSSFDFRSVQVAFFTAGGVVSKEWAPRAEQAGCWVVDNTSFFRQQTDIALVIPEINGSELQSTGRKIIANPNCSTIQMLMALAPLEALSPLQRIFVATYQSVSGAGRLAVQEWQNQVLGGSERNHLPRLIEGNVIPQIDVFLPGGSTKEEQKMVLETHKIMRREIPITATCVRVPVFRGHSEAVAFQLRDPIPLEDLVEALASFPGIVVCEDKEHFVTPIEVVGRDEVFVSRLRVDPSVPCGYQMWVVADNLRKGAALNSLQIAELLARRL